MKGKSFVTLFAAYRDFHFYKDPGQIPYRFIKFGYNSKIISYKNEKEYLITKKYIKIKFLNSSKIARKFSLSIIFFLIFNAKKIHVLNVFHIKWESLLFAFIYKIFNRKGFVYLKLDNCCYSGIYPWENIFNPDKKPSDIFIIKRSITESVKNYLIKTYFVNNVDMWSVEDKKSYEYYSKNYNFFKNNLIVSYNGHTLDLFENYTIKNFSEKGNIILTVGRLGTHQKSTEILLEAFALIYNKNNWTLHLAGEIDENFKPFIEKFFNRFPNIKHRIIFHGNINKNRLFRLYNRAKIFCLPSRYEGFAITFSEAMYFKNAIITTTYVSPRKIIDNKMGLLVEKDDINGLAKAMQYLIDNPQKIEEFGEKALQFAVKELNWNKIINHLNKEINKRCKNDTF